MDPQPVAQPVSVAVAGSCITRDNFNSRFNPGYKQWFSCDAAANQTSMIAMMSPPIHEPWEARKAFNDYDDWNIRNDLGRGFLTDVVALQPAYVILDFFADVHFGVVELPDGRFYTDNRWKHRHTSLFDDFTRHGELRRIKPHDSEDYFALWCDALDRFAELIARECPDTTVIVHRGFNVRQVLTPERPEGMPIRRYKKLAPLDIRVANEWWDRFDDYAVGTHGWESIDLRDGRYPSVSDHPWGVFYVHYSMDYYPQFLAALNRIDMSHQQVPDVASRLAHMEQARRGEVARLAATSQARARLAHQRGQRVRELEGLSVYRAMRHALGNRLRRRS